MRALEREIHRYKSENIRLLQLEAENKKLQSTLAEYQQSRGEETDILVGCLYELRAKMKNLHPSSTVVNSERGPELNRWYSNFELQNRSTSLYHLRGNVDCKWGRNVHCRIVHPEIWIHRQPNRKRVHYSLLELQTHYQCIWFFVGNRQGRSSPCL